METNKKIRLAWFKPELVKKTVITAILLLAFYILSMTLVYCIPEEAMRKQVDESYEVIGEDGKYPTWFFGSPVCFFDNYSDARMLNMALQTNGNPFYAAMSVDFSVKEGSEDTDFEQYYNLASALDKSAEGSESYGRMWHGYLVWLKPLLTFLNLHEIRNLIYFFSFFLYVLTILAVQKKLGFRSLFPFLCGTLLCYTTITTINMMFSIDINLMLAGVLMVTVLFGTNFYNKYETLLFALIGTSMAFWGTFEAPMITLMMPLLIAIQAHYKEGKPAKQLWGKAIINCVGYGSAYAVTLVTKWVLAAAVTGGSDGASVSGQWIGLPPSFRDYLYRLYSILSGFLTPLWSVGGILVLIAVILLLMAFLFRKKHIQWSRLIPFVFAAGFPAYWALVLYGHSGHGFTRFLMMMPVDAVLFVGMNLIDWNKVHNRMLKSRWKKTGLLD